MNPFLDAGPSAGREFRDLRAEVVRLLEAVDGCVAAFEGGSTVREAAKVEAYSAVRTRLRRLLDADKTSDEDGVSGNGPGRAQASGQSDRQGGEGDRTRAVAPDGPSPDLPADLIDRAVEALDRAAHRQTIAVHGYSGAGKPMTGPDGQVLWSLKVGVLAAAPLLVEHGAEQEKARWEARIEKLDRSMEADERDHRTAANLEMPSGPCDCSDCGAARRSLTDAADLIAGDRALLRSLLTGEGENGE